MTLLSPPSITTQPVDPAVQADVDSQAVATSSALDGLDAQIAKEDMVDRRDRPGHVLDEQARADIMLAPSTTGPDMDSEGGAPTTILDAQASGTIVIGSTLSVYPAAFVPLAVVENGNPMVIVNQGRTDHDFRASALVDGAAGDVVPELVDRLARD